MENDKKEEMKYNFHIFGFGTLLYACVYAFCMHENDAGITFLIFVIAGLVYCKYCMNL